MAKVRQYCTAKVFKTCSLKVIATGCTVNACKRIVTDESHESDLLRWLRCLSTVLIIIKHEPVLYVAECWHLQSHFVHNRSDRIWPVSRPWCSETVPRARHRKVIDDAVVWWSDRHSLFCAMLINALVCTKMYKLENPKRSLLSHSTISSDSCVCVWGSNTNPFPPALRPHPPIPSLPCSLSSLIPSPSLFLPSSPSLPASPGVWVKP